MLYILFLTGKCNLNCRYCGGSIDENIMPPELTYSISELRKFIEDDKNPIIAFYGGEPLLRIKLMERIMDKIQAKYVLQTNGIFLDKIKSSYLRRFSSILVSIDGRKSITDYYRGSVYQKVIENIKKIKKNGYSGELIARMVAGERTEIFTDVKHLLNLNLFSHIHWQIDAIWSGVERLRTFDRWVERYNSEVSILVNEFVSSLREGKVLGIVPFLGVLKALIYEPNTAPPCGAGVNSVSITTDGRVLACPVCPEFEWDIIGDIHTGISKKSSIGYPCNTCKIFDICGGRCLFTHIERLWGDRGFNLVCRTVKHLVNEMKNILPIAEELIEAGIIEKESLIYPKFLNSTEIIP